MKDPRERAGCCCPRLGARDCSRARAPARTDDLDPFNDDECACACHALYEQDLDDARDDDSSDL